MKSKGSMSPGDTAVVEAFVAHLRASGEAGLQIDTWPDRVNRTKPEIDAIAGRFAIEHTSIDTLPEQRLDNDLFMQGLGNLEGEFHGSFTFHLSVQVPYDATIPGRDLVAIEEAMRNWLTTEAGTLSDGYHRITSSNVPFHFHVWKNSTTRFPGLYFARTDPNDTSLGIRVRVLLDRKAAKLRRYHQEGKTTVLLVESEDLALMSVGKLLAALRLAYEGRLPDGVDQLWFADTSIPPDIEFVDLTVAATWDRSGKP